MTGGEPRVTVVMPVYNLGRFMPQAVKSLRAQTLRQYELIVVDDGSTDPQTLGLLDTYRQEGMVVLRIENQGLAAARNHGIAAGRGEYAVSFDPDDVLLPRFLERTVAKLDEVPAAGIATTGVAFFGRRHGRWVPPEPDFTRLLCSNVLTSCSLFRRACWEEVGGYADRTQADVDSIEDWSFWISILEHGWTWAVVPETLYRFRARKGSLSDSSLAHRPRLLRELVRLHEESYREHAGDIFVRMHETNRALRTRGFRARVRRTLRI